MKRIAVSVLLVMVGSIGVYAHDFDTSYFGEKSDYENFIFDEIAVTEGAILGWWYPTYEEFLGK